MNNISTIQNDRESLQLLAAQRQSYSTAKTLATLQSVLSLGVPIMTALVVAANEELKVWGALAGLVVSLADVLLFEPFQKMFRDRAATIQEMFDCRVLALPWNAWLARPVDSEDVQASSRTFHAKRANDEALLHSWYPTTVSKLPLHLARLICQRANCRWDAQLRRFYAWGLGGAVFAVAVFVVALGLIRQMTIDHLVLAILAPLLPAILWGLREMRRQRESAVAADGLKLRAVTLWQDAISGRCDEASCEAQSRQFQDAIYIHRKRSPFVFDWVYWLFRARFEAQMYASAQRMIEEVEGLRLSSPGG